MRWRVWLGAAAIALLAAVPARAAEAIRIGVIGLIADAGIYVAVEKGYYREAGLDVKLEPFATSVKMLPVLSAGQLDVATGGVAARLFNGVARGPPSGGVGAMRTCIYRDLTYAPGGGLTGEAESREPFGDPGNMG